MLTSLIWEHIRARQSVKSDSKKDRRIKKLYFHNAWSNEKIISN